MHDFLALQKINMVSDRTGFLNVTVNPTPVNETTQNRQGDDMLHLFDLT